MIDILLSHRSRKHLSYLTTLLPTDAEDLLSALLTLLVHYDPYRFHFAFITCFPRFFFAAL
jgi:hypothetical protein